MISAWLSAAYRALVEWLAVDAIVLVDGGTDILMRGDEAGIGTPEEDMTSLAAVAGLADVPRIVVCLGFGIDAYHGVCHAHVLENLAALAASVGYLGQLADTTTMIEVSMIIEDYGATIVRRPRRTIPH